MSLKNRIQEDVKNAMRARDKARLAALRMVTAAIKQKEVDERIELDETAVLAVLDKMSKQRRESLEQFEQAGREDLAGQERFELELLKDYLPEPLAADVLSALIEKPLPTPAPAVCVTWVMSWGTCVHKSRGVPI